MEMPRAARISRCHTVITAEGIMVGITAAGSITMETITMETIIIIMAVLIIITAVLITTTVHLDHPITSDLTTLLTTPVLTHHSSLTTILTITIITMVTVAMTMSAASFCEGCHWQSKQLMDLIFILRLFLPSS
uniref:Uncharacterized protein n=1 Tax=Branchiostoma floridae TaxID=7739 RepID=C3YDT7_BRAFL|eukprot:XP_002605546.1 hypothetical protein BRAFLDRAFT_130667 [Branchiostoma floridae]